MARTAKDSEDMAEGARMREAYERVLEEIEAVADDELVHINIDVPTAVTTALGALPEIRALRPQIKAELKSIDLTRFDALESYALALFQAHTLYVTALRPAEPLPELVEEATRVRDMLLSDAYALVHRGLLDGQQLRDVKTGPGHRPLAVDLTAVASVMRASWNEIKARTAVEPAELTLAESLAARLLSAIGQRDQAPASAAASALTRNRAFTLFVQAYDEVRRAVAFLRWREGDVEKIVPSLYAGRAPNRKREDPTVTPPARGGPPATGPTPGRPATPASDEGKTDRTGATPSAPAEVGLPDSEPFVPV